MRVLLGITGGIAAYKATGIIRILTEAGHSVKVLPTQNALRFIGAATLEALSHNSIDSDLYTDVADVKHIALAKEADLIIVAPATASFLARYASGLADDLLGNVLLATEAPVVVAPAMHREMWTHAATMTNVGTLERRGVRILTPASGRLTGADSGVGRLPEAEEIVSFALKAVTKQDLAGKSFLITAGGTQENIDPVRFIGNKSSGKQGLAIAKAAEARGACVKLIAANVKDLSGLTCETVVVETAAQMKAAVDAELGSFDCLVMAAAVADFRAETISEQKLKRSQIGDELIIKLVANPDILAETAKTLAVTHPKVLTVGFAAETVNNATEGKALESLALQKLSSKNCDLIVANNVANGQVFDQDTNSVLMITKGGGSFSASGTKTEVAGALLDVISDMLV
jgi:phosphopantothenoylcysteine decarboxylase/phosphopantothenate--cysteine ligase